MCRCAWISWCHFGRLAEPSERRITEEVWFMQKNSETANASAVSSRWMHTALWGFHRWRQHTVHTRLQHVNCFSKHALFPAVNLKAIWFPWRILNSFSTESERILKDTGQINMFSIRKQKTELFYFETLLHLTSSCLTLKISLCQLSCAFTSEALYFF